MTEEFVPASASTGVISVQQNMANSALPSSPVATVIGHRAPSVWETKGWATSTDPSTIVMGTGALPGIQPMEHASLPDPNADVVKIQKTIDAWAPAGWTPVVTPPPVEVTPTKAAAKKVAPPPAES